MKAEIKSIWDSNRKKPNIYIVFQPENEIERAVMRALYFVKPAWIPNSDGNPFLDFYPKDQSK